MTTIFRLRYEISFLILSLTIGLLILISSRGLPEPTYEPMGAAAFPSAIATITVFLVVLKLLRIFFANKSHLYAEENDQSQLRFFKSLCMLLIFIAFVVLVYFFDVRFWVSTFLFMLLAMVFIRKPSGMRGLLIQCMTLIGFSLVLDYVVTNILYFNF
ncbi:tripartite tricarboxylate transporter TctB family protein [Vreelandella olivaria]|uniref:tripartite tricarboxylate transporter TctB family protein n=1 Tax=Vreelandella olivaria TaxID=390919 RepID=UPI00201EB401|nr:tripartite tricarboxylate transporter TctB family protein [Halomonas olivaria]